MSVTQIVEIPASRQLIINVPQEVPAGRAILTLTPTQRASTPRTAAEALQMAVQQAADPNRKPISRLFGKHKGILGGNGVAYQRAIRDEWDYYCFKCFSSY